MTKIKFTLVYRPFFPSKMTKNASKQCSILYANFEIHIKFGGGLAFPQNSTISSNILTFLPENIMCFYTKNPQKVEIFFKLRVGWGAVLSFYSKFAHNIEKYFDFFFFYLENDPNWAIWPFSSFPPILMAFWVHKIWPL